MDTKDKLIEATGKLLWERGYAATSPKAIQKESGIGQGSMYHHFSGKKDLAIAAIERNSEMMRKEIELIFTEKTSPLNRIKNYLLREREILKGCPVGRLVYDPDIYSDEELLELLDNMFQWIMDKISMTLEESMKQNEIRNIKTTELSSTITATLQGSYVIARSKKKIEPFKDAIHGLLSLIKIMEEKGIQNER
ncbi:MAG: TetR/AcrR family transcriptional regulator [Spirochaetales bacterium]|nr:TetR/AcrR family transcriptional regulator [Spirochaetales bacterium]